MSCEGCAKTVSDSLYKLDGIAKVEANVKEQLVRVEGTGTPPKLTTSSKIPGNLAQAPSTLLNTCPTMVCLI